MQSRWGGLRISDFVLLVPDRELEEAEAGVENISKSFIYRRLI